MARPRRSTANYAGSTHGTDNHVEDPASGSEYESKSPPLSSNDSSDSNLASESSSNLAVSRQESESPEGRPLETNQASKKKLLNQQRSKSKRTSDTVTIANPDRQKRIASEQYQCPSFPDIDDTIPRQTVWLENRRQDFLSREVEINRFMKPSVDSSDTRGIVEAAEQEIEAKSSLATDYRGPPPKTGSHKKKEHEEWEAEIVRHKEFYLVFAKPPVPLKGKGGGKLSLFAHPQCMVSKTQLDMITEDIIAIFNQWPEHDRKSISTTFKSHNNCALLRFKGLTPFLQAALIRHNALIAFGNPSLSHVRSNPYVRAAIQHVTPTGEAVVHERISIQLEQARRVVPQQRQELINQLATMTNIVWRSGKVLLQKKEDLSLASVSVFNQSTGAYGSLLEIPKEYEHDKVHYETAELILRTVQVMLHGRAATAKNMDAMIDVLVASLIDPTQRYYQDLLLELWGEHKLFYVADMLRCLYIQPSKVWGRDIGSFALPVRTANRARTTPIIAAANKVMLDTQDSVETAICAAERTQLTNDQIADNKRIEDDVLCLRDDCFPHFPPCSHCGRYKMCNTFEIGRLGVPTCQVCLHRENSSGFKLKKSDNRARNMALTSYRTAIWYEFDGLDTHATEENAGALQQAAEEEIADRFEEGATTFNDDWRGGKPTEVEWEVKGIRYLTHNRLLVSIDRIWKNTFTPEFGCLVLHHAGNIAITLQCINEARNRWVPGLLQVIGDFTRQQRVLMELLAREDLVPEDRERFQSRLVELPIKFIAVCTAMVLVTLEASNRQAQNANSMPSEDECLEFQKNERACRQSPNAPEQQLDLYSNLMRTPLTDNDKKRITCVADQAEKVFQVEVPRCKDGCPLVGHPSVHSHFSGWLDAEYVFGERVYRLRQSCDRHSKKKKKESTSTLFALAILADCASRCTIFEEDEFRIWSPDDKKELHDMFSDLLELPLVFFHYHPLCLAFGHRVHGRDMDSGFEIDFKDLFSFSKDENNMTVEARFTNYLTGNSPAWMYPHMKQAVLELEIPKKFYDPDELVPGETAGVENPHGVAQRDFIQLIADIKRETKDHLHLIDEHAKQPTPPPEAASRAAPAQRPIPTTSRTIRRHQPQTTVSGAQNLDGIAGTFYDVPEHGDDPEQKNSDFAKKTYKGDFPHGAHRQQTSGDEALCSLWAIKASLENQMPDLPPVTEEQLRKALKKLQVDPEYKSVVRALQAQGVSTTEYLSYDLAGSVLRLHLKSQNINDNIIVAVRKSDGQLLCNDNGQDNPRFCWIWHNGKEGLAAHFESLKPVQKTGGNTMPVLGIKESVLAKDRDHQASQILFKEAFPHGADRINNPTEGGDSIYHAVQLSFSAQFPNLPEVTVAGLRRTIRRMEARPAHSQLLSGLMEDKPVLDPDDNIGWELRYVSLILTEHCRGLDKNLDIAVGIQHAGAYSRYCPIPSSSEPRTCWIWCNGVRGDGTRYEGLRTVAQPPTPRTEHPQKTQVRREVGTGAIVISSDSESSEDRNINIQEGLDIFDDDPSEPRDINMQEGSDDDMGVNNAQVIDHEPRDGLLRDTPPVPLTPMKRPSVNDSPERRDTSGARSGLFETPLTVRSKSGVAETPKSPKSPTLTRKRSKPNLEDDAGSSRSSQYFTPSIPKSSSLQSIREEGSKPAARMMPGSPLLRNVTPYAEEHPVLPQELPEEIYHPDAFKACETELRTIMVRGIGDGPPVDQILLGWFLKAARAIDAKNMILYDFYQEEVVKWFDRNKATAKADEAKAAEKQDKVKGKEGQEEQRKKKVRDMDSDWRKKDNHGK